MKARRQSHRTGNKVTHRGQPIWKIRALAVAAALLLAVRGPAAAQVVSVKSVATRNDIVGGRRVNQLGPFPVLAYGTGGAAFLFNFADSGDGLVAWVGSRLDLIAARGDRVGDVTIDAFRPGMVFVRDLLELFFNASARERAGNDNRAILARWQSGEKPTGVVIGGSQASGIQWSGGASPVLPLSANRRGDVAFAVGWYNPFSESAVYWRAQTYLLPAGSRQEVQRVDKAGTEAFDGQRFVDSRTPESADEVAPQVNEEGHLLIHARVSNSGGSSSRSVWLVGDSENRFRPVALEGDLVSDGHVIHRVRLARLAKDRRIGLLLERLTDGPEGIVSPSLYVRENELTKPLVALDSDNPSSLPVRQIRNFHMNDVNRKVLVEGERRTDGAEALFMASESGFEQVASAGRGSILRVTNANQSGHRVVLIRNSQGVTSAHLMDPDGKMTLLLQEGSVTTLGRVVELGVPAAEAAPGDDGSVCLSAVIHEASPPRDRPHVLILTR